jgi:hypothetical protein
VSRQVFQVTRSDNPVLSRRHRKATIDPSQYTIIVPESTAISIYSRIEGAVRDRVTTSRWVSLPSLGNLFELEKKLIRTPTECTLRRLDFFLRPPPGRELQSERHRPGSTSERSDVLGWDRRLAKWERYGSSGRGVIGDTFLVQRVYVSRYVVFLVPGWKLRCVGGL